jgi:hypothetical protein
MYSTIAGNVLFLTRLQHSLSLRYIAPTQVAAQVVAEEGCIAATEGTCSEHPVSRICTRVPLALGNASPVPGLL